MEKKELPEQQLVKIKTIASMFDQERAFIDTAIFRINGEFYGYQPYEQKYKKKYESISNQRLDKIRELLVDFENKLNAEKIDLLLCYVSVEEGGAIINFGSEAVKMKDFVMQELQELEERHAQIS
ncbi:MAG: hypothetical protein IKL33_03845 [Alphaproteobacteria bacterium]|nr:hypothetical protein [Alphaproteobacteria bacterium]